MVHIAYNMSALHYSHKTVHTVSVCGVSLNCSPVNCTCLELSGDAVFKTSLVRRLWSSYKTLSLWTVLTNCSYVQCPRRTFWTFWSWYIILSRISLGSQWFNTIVTRKACASIEELSVINVAKHKVMYS